MASVSTSHLLNIIADSFSGLLAYVDREERYIFVNRKYQEWYGQDCQDIIGQSTREVLGPDIYAKREHNIYRVLQGHKSKFITQIFHQDLGWRMVEQVYEPDVDSNGQVQGFVAMAYDITEQKRMEKSAQDNEARFRSLTEVMPQLVWLTDAEGGFIFINNNWPRLTGTYMEENLGHGWINTIHQDDRVATLVSWQESLKSGNDFESEYRIKMKDGSFRWHMARGIPIKNERDQIERWVGTSTDIHDQKEIEAVQARLLQVLDSSSDFIIMAEPDSRVVYLNQAGRKMVGLEESEDISKYKITDFFFPDDLDYIEEKILSTTLKAGKWIGESRFRHFKTGGECWVHYNSFETRDEKTGKFTGYAAVCRDLTDIKQKERKLEEALVARDQFLSIASHELKTPLTSLKLQSQLTLRSLKSGKIQSVDKQLVNAHQTDELVGRLNRLIDDMLDVSRLRTGKLQLDSSEQELGNIVREVVLRMGVLFEAAHLKLPSIDASEKLIGHWDRFRLEQVIGNLLTNAIRYGQGKSVEIKLRKKGSKAILTVTDHGYGIAQEDLQRIFGRFERAINPSEVSGLGLGLFISKEIIENQKGRIWVESQINQGSTFYIELPLAHDGVKHEQKHL